MSSYFPVAPALQLDTDSSNSFEERLYHLQHKTNSTVHRNQHKFHSTHQNDEDDDFGITKSYLSPGHSYDSSPINSSSSRKYHPSRLQTTQNAVPSLRCRSSPPCNSSSPSPSPSPSHSPSPPPSSFSVTPFPLTHKILYTVAYSRPPIKPHASRPPLHHNQSTNLFPSPTNSNSNSNSHKFQTIHGGSPPPQTNNGPNRQLLPPPPLRLNPAQVQGFLRFLHLEHCQKFPEVS